MFYQLSYKTEQVLKLGRLGQRPTDFRHLEPRRQQLPHGAAQNSRRRRGDDATPLAFSAQGVRVFLAGRSPPPVEQGARAGRERAGVRCVCCILYIYIIRNARIDNLPGYNWIYSWKNLDYPVIQILAMHGV